MFCRFLLHFQLGEIFHMTFLPKVHREKKWEKTEEDGKFDDDYVKDFDDNTLCIQSLARDSLEFQPCKKTMLTSEVVSGYDHGDLDDDVDDNLDIKDNIYDNMII